MNIKFNIRNIIILSILFGILLYFRRGHQLLHPEVWQEDGRYNIISFIDSGWANLLEPVAGYLITIPKLITNISMSISFIYYPEISTYLTWVFTIFVALVVVYSPTQLKYPLIASILVFFIPTDAENFGLPLYTFWFSGILLFLVAMWKENEKQVLKNIILFVNGLSSPLIVLMVPIQIFRYVVFKHKTEELISLVIAILLSIIQISYILYIDTHTNIPIINLDFVYNLINKFFAYYYVRDFILSENILLLSGFYIIVLLGIYAYNNRRDNYYYILLFMLIASIGLSVIRVNPNLLHPILAGPRYFFFPYILLSWSLLYIIFKNKYYFFTTSPILALSIFLSFSHFGRIHDGLNWKNHIATCEKAHSLYTIPIHCNGNKNKTWSISLDPTQCKKLIKNDFFKIPKKDKIIFLLSKTNDKNITINQDDILDNTFISNAVYNPAKIKVLLSYGSYIHGDSDIGYIRFKANKNDIFAIKTGPIIKNQKIRILDKYGNILLKKSLDLNNQWGFYQLLDTIPNNIIVEISDNGTGWGEWSAVAFREIK